MDHVDKKSVTVVMRDGARFQIEVRNAGGYQDVGVLDTIPFDDVTKAIESVGHALNATMDRIAPKRASIEFGLEVSFEAGKLTAVICQGRSTANLMVKLEWGH